MGFLTAFSEIGTVIQTIISLKQYFATDNEQIKILENTEKRLEKIERKQLIESKELFKILRESTNDRIIHSKQIIQGLFGEYEDYNVANKVINSKFSTSADIPNTFEFNAKDFTFSSYGTAGYSKKLDNGKGVIVFHSTDSDKGRFFLVRWGIGWYYRTHLDHQSFLGFPVSNEFATKPAGRTGSKQNFEGGYIEYLAEHDELRIFRTSFTGVKLVVSHKF